MLLFAAPDWPIGPAAPFILLLALALDALIGDPRWLPHPVRLMGWLTGLLDRALNREGHGEGARVILGGVAVLLVVGASAAAGWAVTHYAATLGWGWLAEIALVAMLLAQRDMADHMVRVARALDHGAEPARDAVRNIVGRDLRALDEHGIARAAIESGAENYSDGVVAPAFWYLLLGLPGLLAYKAINTMDSMIGHRSPRHLAFGRAAARIDDAVNWMPARIAGALIAFAALRCARRPAGPGVAHHAARRPPAQLAQRRLARGRDGRRAGSRAAGPPPLRGRGGGGPSLARRRAPGRDGGRSQAHGLGLCGGLRAGGGAHRSHRRGHGARQGVAEAQRARATSSRRSRSRWASRWAPRASRVSSTRAS